MEFRFRRAIFLKFGLCLWAVCVGYTGGFFLWEVFGQGRPYTENKALELSHHLRLAKDLLAKDQSRELVEVLRHSLRKGDIHFFGWRSEGRWVTREGSEPPENVAGISGQVTRTEGAVVALLEAGTKELVLGSTTDWRARARDVWRDRLSYLAKDILFLAMGLILLAVFFFQEIAHSFLPKSEVQRDWRAPRPKFVPKVLRENDITPLSTGFFASLQLAESFRVDSNEKAKVLDQQIQNCSRLAERYHGRLVESNCRGSSFLFPDSTLALSAARDWQRLGPLAVFVSEGASFAAAAGRPLYGAALAEGWRRLTSLEPGIWVSKKYIGDQFRFQPQSGLFTALPALSLPEALALAREGKPANIAYFRADEDLGIILQDLKNSRWPREQFLPALATLRSFQALSESKDLSGAYLRLLKKELTEKDSYRISAVLALAAHLFHPKAISRELERTFLEVLNLPDRRTKANAIEIFIHFFPEREIPALELYVKDLDNRISANALVKAALERFDEQVVRKIEERLKGGSVAHVASALYALGEIAHYYQRRDPLYLGTKLGFLKIFESIPNLAVHPNPMVMRQALVAAKKLGDPALDRQLEKIFHANKDESLAELFASIYGWRKNERAA
jgi:hypothetical protein